MTLRRKRALGKHDKDLELRIVKGTVTYPEYLWVYDEARRAKKSISAVVRSCIIHVRNCAKTANNQLSNKEPGEVLQKVLQLAHIAAEDEDE